MTTSACMEVQPKRPERLLVETGPRKKTMIPLAQINAELAKASDADVRLDLYEVVRKNDCFFVEDRAECPAALSSRLWRCNFILQEVAGSWSLSDWLAELRTMAKERS